MSAEGKMLQDMKMPSRKEVGEALLKALFRHGGVIKEFGDGEEIVNEIASNFNLSKEQRSAYLTTIYKKENREKKSYLWHRLLFRAADELANIKLISRPSQTIKLTNRREWMLLEKGFDRAMEVLKIPIPAKRNLQVKSFEVQKIVKKLSTQIAPKNYVPFDKNRKRNKISREFSLRNRGFRLAVIEAYDYKCAVCGLKLNSPDSLYWEVEAAHIVPHRLMGKDDIWNGISLCKFHHWCFDVGWFTILDNYYLKVSSAMKYLPDWYGKTTDYDYIRNSVNNDVKIQLPKRIESYPHQSSINWHQKNVFHE